MEKINEIKKLIENNLNDYTKTLKGAIINQPKPKFPLWTKITNDIAKNTCLSRPSTQMTPPEYSLSLTPQHTNDISKTLYSSHSSTNNTVKNTCPSHPSTFTET